MPESYLSSVPPMKLSALDGEYGVVGVLSSVNASVLGWEPSDELVIAGAPSPSTFKRKEPGGDALSMVEGSLAQSTASSKVAGAKVGSLVKGGKAQAQPAPSTLSVKTDSTSRVPFAA